MKEFAKRFITALCSGILFFGSYCFFPRVFSAVLILILAYIVIIEWPHFFHVRSIRYWMMVVIYTIFPIAALLYLHHNYFDVSMWIPLYPFLAAWTCDTGSYLVGIWIGSHKMCPHVSAGKSWEGLGGGFFSVFGLNILLLRAREGVLYIVGVSVVVTLLAFFGDLFISYMKRLVNIKDSGRLLPGHGGLLDRFDSVFLVAIATALFLMWSEFGTYLLYEQLFMESL